SVLWLGGFALYVPAKPHRPPFLRTVVSVPVEVLGRTGREHRRGASILNPSTPLGCVVVAGSIGRRHAQRLAKRCERMVFVDPSDGARQWGQDHLDVPVSAYARLEAALDGAGPDLASALGT